ncbi:MAG: hypothetical protein WC730_03870 [Patescibacteria group bacterium]|jgi:hypothetical protein
MGEETPKPSFEETLEEIPVARRADLMKMLLEKRELLPIPKSPLEIQVDQLSNTARAAIERIERTFESARDAIEFSAAEGKLRILRDLLATSVEILDLESREKFLEAAIELIPYIGSMYAVTGRKITFDRHESTGLPIPHIEKISWTDRGIYLAGECLISGHLLVGIKNALREKGLAGIWAEIKNVFTHHTQQVLIARNDNQ